MDDKTVLVIEQSSVVSDLVRDLLEAARLSVVQASSAKAGLALVNEQRFDAILVDANLPVTDGYAVLEQIRTNHTISGTPVLFLTSKGKEEEEQRESSYRPTAYIQQPIDPVELIIRVRAAVGRDTPTFASSGSGPSPRSELDSVGKIITVYSLKGGVGTSTIAVNLAVALRRLWDESVALVDLSLESGSLNVFLDMMPLSTVDELVAQDGDLNSAVIGQYLVPHKSGVSLLSAPASPERAELVSGMAVRKVLELLRDAFHYVVIDTASNFADYSLPALEMADNIVVPIGPDIASVRSTTTALDIFQALSIPDDRIVAVFNEVAPKIGLSKKHVESTVKLTVTALPPGGAKVMDSINLGAPIAMTDPDHAFSIAIENLAFELSRPESKDKDRARPSDRLTKLRKRLKV